MTNEEKKIESVKARNILDLIKSHKEHCDEDCGITLYWLLEDFERHAGRKATSEEIKHFL